MSKKEKKCEEKIKEEKIEETKEEIKEEINLEEKVKELEEKLKEEEGRYIRLYAEFQNFSKRKENELKTSIKFSSQKIIEKILPTFENLERALLNIDINDESKKSIYEGINMTYNSFKTVLESEGLEIINPELGTIYDPQYHEAVGITNDSEKENESIVMVYSKGYKLNGKLISTAKVQINKK